MSVQQQICRLCLKVKIEVMKIDEIMRQMFYILLKLDLDITRDAIICQDCVEVAKKCLNFKYTCIRTEQIILSYVADRKGVKYNIKVIYEQKKHGFTVFDQDFKICRFCMTRLERNNIVSLDAFVKKSMFEMLSEYMAEMDFNNTEYPLICINCIENLYDYFKFVRKCLESEVKLKAYCKKKATDAMGQVHLGNVLQFKSTDILVYPDKRTQTYKNEQDCLECVYPETYIGLMMHEELDIKGEELIYLKTQKQNVKERNTHNHMLVNKDVPEKIIHKCSLCAFEFKHKSSLTNHMVVHKNVSEIKMYKCSLCAYETKYRRGLQAHTLVHKDSSEVEMYKCLWCTYETKQRRYLNRHVLVHKDVSEIKMYKCSLCPYEAKEKSRLTAHTLVHKDISQIKMYKCHLCAYESKKKGNIKSHLLVHKDISEIEVHKCSLCDFESKHKSSLKNHVVVHKNVSETRMYNCSLCAYETKHQRSLKSHMMVHKDVSEMYKCSWCAYETKQRRYLNRHMLVHTDVTETKMHKCSLCDYEGKHRSYLNRHMLVHM